MQHPSEASFLHDVRNHAMEVIRDDGVNRHIRFRAPGTMSMHFDLITWPGYLCFTGDMGTFVFQRLHDMFEFFRTDRDSPWLKRKGLTLGINPSYWGEKLQSIDRACGYKKFSEEKFNRAVLSRLVGFLRDHRDVTTKEQRRELWDDAISYVICADGDSGGFRKQAAAHDYILPVGEVGNFTFGDFWEVSVEDYSYQYLWCCYALAWGIRIYDQEKDGASSPVASAAA